jgi:hypothetical protein
MKITQLEGTPEEINEYQIKQTSVNKKTIANTPKLSQYPCYTLADALMEEGRHWSRTKCQWVFIRDMDKSYILNVLKQKFNSGLPNEKLLKNEEVRSLILTLADRIKETKWDE